MSLDEQDDRTATEDGQVVPVESTGHTSGRGLPFREPAQNTHTGAAVDVIDLTGEADKPRCIFDIDRFPNAHCPIYRQDQRKIGLLPPFTDLLKHKGSQYCPAAPLPAGGHSDQVGAEGTGHQPA